MALIWRVLVAIIAVNLVTLTVFVGLATLQYNAILSGLIRDRLVVLIEKIRDPFEAVADIGVPLSTVRNANAILERARLSDDSILGIYLIDPQNNVVQVAADRTLPLDTLLAGRPDDGSVAWQVETRGSFVIGTVIRSSFGANAGSIVVEYSKREAKVQVLAMATLLVLLAGGVLAVSVVIGWLILRRVLAEHVRVFEGLLESFDAFEMGFWRGLGKRTAPENNVKALGLETTEFRELLETSEDRYRQKRATMRGQEQAGNSP
ncbi:hypothetical protein [Aliiruegeria lutimaris]|uniref:HAMP domain-containing protein n=1 Tax=Aliiruegeria lutimaris TaxID=571298 RepID=A0A1G9NSG9_9RHOB|nr:hypothetical protein [Aliiruegeria lutimaris]SDL89340.1 hypothetical protein SAMN04488026_11281 [Aliiruegeria lutimaris]